MRGIGSLVEAITGLDFQVDHTTKFARGKVDEIAYDIRNEVIFAYAFET
jgi:hypothetical protein